MSVSMETKESYPELYTMSHAYANICLGTTPWVALGNFMNDFFGSSFSDSNRREELLQASVDIPSHPSQEQQKWAVFCAASVEYLCNKYHLYCPLWVQTPFFAPLPEPWYHYPVALVDVAVREQLIRETPQEFACKNIYCGNRVYANKYEVAAELRHKSPPIKE